MDGRFKKIPGLDYKKGAVEYPEKLSPGDRYHLYTKPFYNLANKVSRWTGDGLDDDTQRHFCDFANIACALALPAGSRILDVGCGSGWLTEYFSRLGYDATGIDVSPGLIRIANERLAGLAFGADEETALKCRFRVHNVEGEPLPQTFDAIICYDSLHHFDDEHAVVRNLAQMLDYGGLLFVAEGEKPPPGSSSEAELIEVMERFQTLESPFTREYLSELLQQYGFTIAGDYLTITGFLDRDNFSGNSVNFVEPPAFNYLLCKKTQRPDDLAPIPDTRKPGLLRASFHLESEWPGEFGPSAEIKLEVRIENTGDTLWLVSRAPLVGRVRLGLKILDTHYQTFSEIHGQPPLQRPIAPGESVLVRISCTAPTQPANYILKLDLVNQDICWFETEGSDVLNLPFTVVEGDG
jgi:SAM-dependent methyltransferase